VPWGKSIADPAFLESLVATGVLPPNTNPARPVWITPASTKTDPKPPTGYVVSLARLYERGFGIPVCRFFRALCHHYGVELHNFAPNAISHAVVFFAVYEGYLGVNVHWDLWRHLFRGELHTDSVSRGVRRPVRGGGFMLQVREKRKDMYIPSTMTSNNHDWDKAWFYLRNDNRRFPAYTGKILTERPESWAYGVSPVERQAKLKVFTEVLRRLADKGLTAAVVATNFHRQTVLPLMERRLPLYQLTPKASSEGSQMMEELLSRKVAAQRARRTMAAPPSNPRELWVIKMRPEAGYI
jgi:hypothetical protein